MNADCTITYRQGKQPLCMRASRAFPWGPASNPLCARPCSGHRAKHRLILQAGCFGASGGDDSAGPLRTASTAWWEKRNPPMIPVTVQIQSTLNTQEDYRFEVIQEPFLSPVFVNLAFRLNPRQHRSGPSAHPPWKSRGRSGWQGRRNQWTSRTSLSGEMGTAALAGSAVACPPSRISWAAVFPDLHIEGIDLSVKSTNERSLATAGAGLEYKIRGETR